MLLVIKINDGKANFYRTLNLDKADRKLIRFYRGLVKDMLQEPENKQENHIDKESF
jgi:hypothetical protein